MPVDLLAQAQEHSPQIVVGDKMLVRLISDLYYDTPINSIGYTIRQLSNGWNDDVIFLVRFSIGTEEVAEKLDLEIIQEIE